MQYHQQLQFQLQFQFQHRHRNQLAHPMPRQGNLRQGSTHSGRYTLMGSGMHIRTY
ncbi:hypothetical protein SAMN05660479_02871 [Microbulbifer thermotolerans]|nr:hypothetical protein SAMN05660479_02871 [Microbulbifer thermotolerans]